MSGDRGQAYTLEGLAAATLVLLALVLSMQSIVITPTTEGSIDENVASQLETQAGDALAVAHERDALAEAALFWDADDGEWRDEWRRGDCPETDGGDELALCRILEESFAERLYRYNVYVDYRNADRPAETETIALYEQGTPGDNAVVATRSVTTYEGMELTGQSDPPTLEAVDDDPDREFYAGNMDDEYVYNIVEIRVVVW